MKNKLKTAVKGITKWINVRLPTSLLALGAVAVSVGVGMIYIPAGTIAAGVLMMLAGVLMIKGGDSDE
ncbi:MAG: hypothetical protein Q4P84_04865 [Elusimicrobiales bacterium]|nr:hypothetical protein [Elusimicrobiales bacterium]